MAIIESSSSEKVIEALERIPEELLGQVEEITLDIAESMRKIVRCCFPNARRVIDRFHVQKLAYDALQKPFSHPFSGGMKKKSFYSFLVVVF